MLNECLFIFCCFLKIILNRYKNPKNTNIKKEIDKPPNMINKYQFLYFFYSGSFNNDIGENQGNNLVTKVKYVSCKELLIL